MACAGHKAENANRAILFSRLCHPHHCHTRRRQRFVCGTQYGLLSGVPPELTLYPPFRTSCLSAQHVTRTWPEGFAELRGWFALACAASSGILPEQARSSHRSHCARDTVPSSSETCPLTPSSSPSTSSSKLDSPKWYAPAAGPTPSPTLPVNVGSHVWPLHSPGARGLKMCVLCAGLMTSPSGPT